MGAEAAPSCRPGAGRSLVPEGQHPVAASARPPAPLRPSGPPRPLGIAFQSPGLESRGACAGWLASRTPMRWWRRALHSAHSSAASRVQAAPAQISEASWSERNPSHLTSGKEPFLTMSSIAIAEPDGDEQDRGASKLIFFLFVFGAVLLCVGLLLSIFGYQACQYEPLPDCNMVLKIAGPSCAVIGLGAVILARSRARLQLLVRRRQGNQVDSDQAFLCGESRQFAQCLIFGFLFLTSGLLVSILGIWVPGCSSDWAQDLLNETDTISAEPQICGFLSLQIMGPLIVLMGLCFFVVAHVKKKNNLSVSQDASESEEGHGPSTEPVQVTVGDSVIIFPPPPPPYFPESSTSAGSQSPGANSLLPTDSPPPYFSLFSHGTSALENQDTAHEQEHEFVYTISGPHSPPEITHAPRVLLELPPRYEEKETPTATSLSLPSELSAP
ncbi:transmembrane protein 171 isoform X2 [Heterocephalus glaber]|uniref:Transmembrane protein 171 isoform X2 n=2 Tax=Heterocephalus glaber TaxID=10181 RepID=A0AAX6QGF8_HETGA|nr:transmembrane protein 171 isoform X2 [Heterocephalus glaber]